AALAQRLHRGPECVHAAAVLAASAGTGAADEPHAEVAQHGTHQLGVAVARQHDVHLVARLLDQRQQRNCPCHMVMTHGWLWACSSNCSVISADWCEEEPT